MQTILGAGGAIGTPLASHLSRFTPHLRLVSRKPVKINEGDQLHPADLTQREAVFKAVEGSEVVYLTIGFEYKTSVWQERWPRLMRDVTDACMAHGSKLVFFDNVYAVSPRHMNRITEDSPLAPSSKKGEVRAQVDRLLMELAEKGKLDVIIARAPDFMGPIKERSIVMNLMYDRILKGKKSQWFCNARVIHTTGYTHELALGTAMLGNAPGTFNQVWNLPVDPEPITPLQMAQLFATELGGPAGCSALPKWGIRLFGLFVPVLREMVEMTYQYDRDYYFDSSRFNRHFNHQPVTNAQAVKETVQALREAAAAK